jgi:hypothetical protein
MILDYLVNPPSVVTSNQANVSFPAFYFNDDDLYFIYPNEAIIYNYTLGLFFEHIKTDIYKKIQLRSVVNEMEGLNGYTQANPNQLPTLYYANGRLTLQHANCSNIGWHPRKEGYTYVYGNILHPNDPKVFARKTIFDQAAFNLAIAAVNAQNFQQSRLIELYYDTITNVITSRHVSRSQLILGPPPNFVLNIVNQFLAAKEMNPSPF